MPRIRLFAYGTLLEEKTQRRVFKRVIKPASARLAGWRAVPRMVRKRYWGIGFAPGRTTAGGVLKLDARELARADAYEGTLYRRRRVSVRLGRRPVRCWVYVPVTGPAPGNKAAARP